MRMELVVLLMCFFGCKKEVNDHQSNQLGVSDEGGGIYLMYISWQTMMSLEFVISCCHTR